ncbi:ankyrin repeat protein [Moumouvirus australiensis]|uniref:Ankyrin repeat protein n=1 Tax=Moumouvirus australiensis TaxID=2109587 RepID=A0A2P1EKR3_9VIRU|nr:ankyrin repeat protein [Moumouvirus australiensis]AVL94482.1 ankyrin repeat protein [Moumouvirus australiensis]
MNCSFDQEMIDLVSNTSDELLLSVLEKNIGELISSGETKCYRTLKRIFYDLVQRKHLDSIKYILESDLTENVTKKIDNFCIYLSCKFGYLELLQYLNELGINIWTKKLCIEIVFYDNYDYDEYDNDELYDDQFFKSSMDIAIKYKHMEIIKYLSCEETNVEGFTTACLKKNLELVKYFLVQQEYDMKTILYAFDNACGSGSLEIVKHLMPLVPVDKRCDKYIVEGICHLKNIIDIIKYLVEQNWEISINFTLKEALNVDNLELFKYLTTQYPDIKYSAKNVVNRASLCGGYKILEYLMTNDNLIISKKYIKSKKFNRLFETVSERGYFEVFKLLHSLNNKVDLYESFTNACENGHLNIAQFIISNHKNFLSEKFRKNGNRYLTYLMRLTFARGQLDVLKYLETIGISRSYISQYAASLVVGNGYKTRKQLECIKWLYEDINFHKYSEAIAIKAFRSNRDDIIRYLVSVGLNIQPIISIALDYVCINGNLDCLKYLIECGVDITINNNRAIKLAAQENHIEVVKCLVENGADIKTDNDFVMKIATLKNYNVIKRYLVSLGLEEVDIHSIGSLELIRTIKNPDKDGKNWLKHHGGFIYPNKLMSRP